MKTTVTTLLITIIIMQTIRVSLAEKDVSPAESRKVEPLLDVPLRDTAVCRGPDGTYYLTGASGTPRMDGTVDFQNNDGIWVWKSRDLRQWEEIGQVWSISRDPQRFGNPFHGSPSVWQGMWRANAEGAGPAVRGVVAPEIHYLKGNFYIPYSMNGQGTGLLASESGKAEGPYKDFGKITRGGSDPSLFQDSDGSVYWLWGEGWIARMKDDLSGLAEEPRLLRVEPDFDGDAWPVTIGCGGAFLFKAASPGVKGEYHLIGYDVLPRMGATPCFDTFIATAPSVYGPYSSRRLLVPHGGQSTVFEAPDGSLMATFAGRDAWAAVRDRPALVPLVPRPVGDFEEYSWGGAFLKPWYPVTESGAWSKMNPLVPRTGLRDVSILNAPDGYYYMTCTDMEMRHSAKREDFGIRAWRSKDLVDWEDIGLVWRCDDSPETREALTQVLARGGKPMTVFDPEMHFLKGTYWLVASMKVGEKWHDKDGCLVLILRSTSGRAEGPYEFTWKGPHTAELWTPSLFEDDDGTVYIVGGGIGNTLGKVKDDLSGLASELWKVLPEGMSAVGEGGHLFKIGTTYFHSSAVWHGADPYDRGMALPGRRLSTYDLMVSSADHPRGPWSQTYCAAPKCGNSRPFQDKKGNWFAPFFGNHFSGPWKEMPGIYPLKVTKSTDRVKIEPVQ